MQNVITRLQFKLKYDKFYYINRTVIKQRLDLVGKLWPSQCRYVLTNPATHSQNSFVTSCILAS